MDKDCELKLWHEGRNPFRAKSIARSCEGYIESPEYISFMQKQLKIAYFNFFSQNDDLKDILLETYPLALVEASTDRIFGIGCNLSSKRVFHYNLHRGKNIAGNCLMHVRSEFLKEKNLPKR